LGFCPSRRTESARRGHDLTLETTAQQWAAASQIITALFAETLALELGLYDGMKTAKLEVAIGEKLKRSPRPLFIDQANYLQETALGTVCYVWEKARIPVVLVGNKDLHDLFYRSRLTQDVRALLSSRVALHYLLSELTPGEAKAIIQRG
jgi:hypothetical protein